MLLVMIGPMLLECPHHKGLLCSDLQTDASPLVGLMGLGLHLSMLGLHVVSILG